MFRLSPTSIHAWVARAAGPTAAEAADAYAIEAAREAGVDHRRVHRARRPTAEVGDRAHAWNRKRVTG